MQNPTSSRFQKTKLILQGKEEQPEVIRKLVEWMKDEFSCEVIHAFHYRSTRSLQPILYLVFKSWSDYYKVASRTTSDISQKAAQKIIHTFTKMVNEDPKVTHPSTQNLWLEHGIFSKVAIMEILEQFPGEKLQLFVSRYPDLIWKIVMDPTVITIFYFTHTQQLSSGINHQSNEIRNELINLLKPFDEFNFISPETVNIQFSNKEKVDRGHSEQ